MQGNKIHQCRITVEYFSFYHDGLYLKKKTHPCRQKLPCGPVVGHNIVFTRCVDDNGHNIHCRTVRADLFTLCLLLSVAATHGPVLCPVWEDDSWYEQRPSNKSTKQRQRVQGQAVYQSQVQRPWDHRYAQGIVLWPKFNPAIHSDFKPYSV